MADLTGKTLGNYRVHRRLGKGGMGEVYLAHDLPLDRAVALKVMLPSWAHDASIVERFHREARAAARLSHPSIVQIFAVGADSDMPYFAMEYIDGMALDKLLKSQGPMPWQRVLQIVGQVSSALDAAHAKGIIHRDIKPANILIDRQGRARVTDFGVAKVLSARTQLTTDGAYVGTPQYMSPEQCGIGEVTPASDLFSLGVTAYEMLTGSAPFAGNTPATLIRSITQETPRPVGELVMGLPKSVCDLVHAMLEKDTASRFKSAREVMNEISRIFAGGEAVPNESTVPRVNAAPAGTSRSIGIRNTAIIGTAALLCVGALLLIGHRIRVGHGTSPAPSAESPQDASVEDVISASDPNEIFLSRDTNKDGRLSASEIPAAAAQFFKRADSNNDHFVDMDEYMVARQRMKDGIAGVGKRAGPALPKPRPAMSPEETLATMDKNHDGFLTPEEIPPQFPNLMRAADANRDGKLSVKEIQESRRLKR